MLPSASPDASKTPSGLKAAGPDGGGGAAEHGDLGAGPGVPQDDRAVGASRGEHITRGRYVDRRDAFRGVDRDVEQRGHRQRCEKFALDRFAPGQQTVLDGVRAIEHGGAVVALLVRGLRFLHHELGKTQIFRLFLGQRVEMTAVPDAGDRHHDASDHERRLDAQPQTPALLALAQLVVGDVENAGEQLEQAVGLAVLVGARVCGDRFRGLARQAPLAVDLEAERFGKALEPAALRVVRSERRAVDDQADDTIFPAQRLERSDLLVDPARRRGVWRTEHHQIARLLERFGDLVAQARRSGQLLAIAEHRDDAPRHRPVARRPADQTARHAIALERLVKPASPGRVLVAVADECPVLERVGRRRF